MENPRKNEELWTFVIWTPYFADRLASNLDRGNIQARTKESFQDHWRLPVSMIWVKNSHYCKCSPFLGLKRVLVIKVASAATSSGFGLILGWNKDPLEL